MRRIWKATKSNPSLAVGCLVVGMLLLTALVSLFYTPHDTTRVDVQSRHLPPSVQHPFGTDRHGRDIFSRSMEGAQVVVSVGFISVGIGLTIGTLIGVTAGYYRGWFEEVLMRIMDGLYAFPPLLFAIIIAAIWGSGISKTIIAIGVVNIPIFARLVRSGFIVERKKMYVEAARSIGVKDKRIIWVHILPNLSSILLVQVTASFAIAILAEAGLSYLGLGTQPPNPSWGRMLRESRNFLSTAPWSAIFPGICVLLAVLGFNMLGDGLRDALDPELKTKLN